MQEKIFLRNIFMSHSVRNVRNTKSLTFERDATFLLTLNFYHFVASSHSVQRNLKPRLLYANSAIVHVRQSKSELQSFPMTK